MTIIIKCLPFTAFVLDDNYYKMFTFYRFFVYRSFAKPPAEVQRVCECIVIFKGIKEVSWKSAKAMMAEANFLKSLQEMDVDGISQMFTFYSICFR
jgi:hypothetical protein